MRFRFYILLLPCALAPVYKLALIFLLLFLLECSRMNWMNIVNVNEYRWIIRIWTMNLQCTETDHGLAVWPGWSGMDDHFWRYVVWNGVTRLHSSKVPKYWWSRVMCWILKQNLIALHPDSSPPQRVRQVFTCTWYITVACPEMQQTQRCEAKCRRATASCNSTATLVTTVPH